MAGIINMQSMRYMNIFSRITNISTKYAFDYNNSIVFGVPKSKMSLAIGKNAENVKKINLLIRKKIKIIAMPEKDDYKGIEKFILDIVSPIEVSNVSVDDNSATITANKMSKASLIGRDRAREKELLEILKNNFSILNLKIN
jgi:NusA-like KH domain protein